MAGNAGESRRDPSLDPEGRFVRAWQATRGAGRRLGLLAKTKPYLAMGVAAGMGAAAGVLVGTRLARAVVLMAVGYAIHGMRGSGEPLLKAGVERLARALAS